MSVAVDACAVVAGLVDTGPAGTWAEQLLTSQPLAAPHLMPGEAANILRRAARAGDISAHVAALAHRDLLDLPVELFDYEPFADRVWELRHTVTAYDAWYVAVAESLNLPLVTVDLRLSRAPGPRCAFATPPTGASAG